jgi:hypothetical protein
VAVKATTPAVSFAFKVDPLVMTQLLIWRLNSSSSLWFLFFT